MRFVACAVAGFFIIGCAASFTKVKLAENRDTIKQEEQPVAKEAVPQQSKNARLTNIDTLNSGKEIRLVNTDFQIVSAPATAPLQPAQSPSQDITYRFRIQVFASNQIETLRQEKKNLESRVDIPLFIAFESPYYKLYAGDFTSRNDAENYLPRLKKMGYNDSWVVRTKALSQ